MRSILCAAAAALVPSPASSQCIVARFEHAGPIAIHASDRTRLAIVDGVEPWEGVFVYDAETGEELVYVPMPSHDRFRDVAIDGELLALGHPRSDPNYMGEVHVHDLRTGALLAVLDHPPGFDDFFGEKVEVFDGYLVVSEPDFVPGSGLAHYYASFDATRWTTGDPSTSTDYSYFPSAIAVGERAGSPIAAFGAFEESDGHTMTAWHFLTSTPVKIGPLESPAQAFSLAVDGDLLAVGTAARVYVFDLGTEEIVASLPVSLVFGGRVCFSDGLLSVGTGVGASDGGGRIVVYDQTTWTPVLTLDAPAGASRFGRDACLAGDRLATYVEIDGVAETRVYSVPRAESEPWDSCEWDDYCAPLVPNSTGERGGLVGLGSEGASAEDLTLEASDLPPGNVCLFLASVNQGFHPTPGTSCGNLCLTGPDIARFKFDAQLVDAQGRAALTIDPFVVLTNPPQPILAGQTWNFQAWHRDAAGRPRCNSNFTGACSVTFR